MPDDDRSSDRRSTTRRRVLAGSAATAGGLAGCAQQNSDDEESPRSRTAGPTEASPTDTVAQTRSGESMTVDRLYTLEYPHADVTAHGAKGDGETDDTLAIRDALRTVENDPSLDTVFFPNGTYIVDTHNHPRDLSETPPHTGLTVGADNMRLRLAPGATIKAAPIEQGEKEDRLPDDDYGYDGKYRVIAVWGKKNVEIIGGTIDGGRKEHGELNETGGFGHCIQLGSTKNVTIRNVTCKNAWGDGLFVGCACGMAQTFLYKIDNAKKLWPQIVGNDRWGEDTPDEDLVVDNFYADFNRRQGISVVGVDGFWLLNSRLENTKGTNPMAGIDFENHEGLCDRIFVDNLQTVNNTGPGVLVMLDSPSPPGTRIAISNHHDVGSGWSGMQVGLKKDTPLNVQMQNCTWEENKVGLRIPRHIPADDTGRHSIVATDCTAVDPRGSGFRIADRKTRSDDPHGNVVLNNPRVVSTDGDPDNNYAIVLKGTNVGVKNVTVRNPGPLVATKNAVEMRGETEDIHLIDDRVSSMSPGEFNARF